MFFKVNTPLPSTTAQRFSFLEALKPETLHQYESVTLLEKPHSPSAWIYTAIKEGDCGYETDEYRWRNKSPKQDDKSPNGRRFYKFFIATSPPSGQKVAGSDSRFQRLIYKLRHPTIAGDLVLVVYSGDHTISADFAHGNSKKQFFNYVKTETSAKEKVRSECNRHPNVTQTYNLISAECRQGTFN